MARTTQTPQSVCPHCEYAFDSASDIEGDARPKAGDWTLCLRCAGVMVFGEGLRPVMPEPGAYEALRDTEPGLFEILQRHRAAIRAIARTHPIPHRVRRA